MMSGKGKEWNRASSWGMWESCGFQYGKPQWEDDI